MFCFITMNSNVLASVSTIVYCIAMVRTNSLAFDGETVENTMVLKYFSFSGYSQLQVYLLPKYISGYQSKLSTYI